jgi:hypothetical protein
MAFDDVFRIDWRYFVDGYRCVNGRLSGKKDKILHGFLTHNVGTGLGGNCSYSPLEDRTLFRRFAITDPTPEGILGFANQFGFLFDKYVTFIDSESGNKANGEHISVWVDEIGAMHDIVTIWDAINDSNLKVLRNYFSWMEEGAFTARDLTRPNVITVASVKQNLILRFGPPNIQIMSNTPPRMIHIDNEPDQVSKEEKLVAAALTYIEYVINDRGKGHLNIQMIRQDGRLQFLIKSDSLIGVLWLQCAQAISQRKEFRQCKQCNSWFEPYSEKTKKTFCSTACRLKYYRGRIIKAQKLHEQGKTPASIAKILGTDIKTIRGWLAKGGSKK